MQQFRYFCCIQPVAALHSDSRNTFVMYPIFFMYVMASSSMDETYIYCINFQHNENNTTKNEARMNKTFFIHSKTLNNALNL